MIYCPFSSIQSLSCVRLFVTPWTAACQASLSITSSPSLLKLMSIESVMPSNHLILCHPLLLMPSIFPIIRVFSSESVLRIRWPKYWSFSFSISPSSEYSGLISFRMDWLALLTVQGLSRVFSSTTVHKHQFFGAQVSLWSNNHILSLLHLPNPPPTDWCLLGGAPPAPRPTASLESVPSRLCSNRQVLGGQVLSQWSAKWFRHSSSATITC